MSFFFAILYLIVEYMRPQSIYEAISDMPLAEIVIIGIIISFILEKRRLTNHNFQNILMSVYLFWFFISYLFAFNHNLAWQSLNDFTKWFVIYFLLINVINERNRLYIFLIVLLLLNFKYAQFAVRIWMNNGFYSSPKGLHQGAGIGAGFFRNPNDLGVAFSCVLGISFYMMISDVKKIFNRFKMRWLHIVSTLTIPIAILATSSRGSLLALASVIFGIWYKNKRKFIGIAVLIMLTTAFISLIPQDNWARFKMMGTEEDGSGQSRLALWRAGIRMANEYPLTGVGPNNFVYVNRNIYHSSLRQVQHNVFVQAISELGYPGLLLFLMMIVGCFYNQRRTRKILKEKKIDDPFLYGLSHGLDISIVGFIVNGFFITVLYYPFFWTLLILNVALLDIVNQLSNDSRNTLYKI